MSSANLKRAVKRIKATLNANYEQAQVTPTAGPVGTGKAFIGGQVFDANISGVTQVVNVGRPAAAQYAAKVGGGVAVASSGGGGSTSSGGGTGAAITSSFVIADPDALLPNARLLAVSSALSLTDAGAGGAITIGMATPPTLSATSTNDAATGSHAITASAAPGAAESLLKSSSAGNLALVSLTTPLVNTSSGNLSLRPASGTVALQNSGGTDRASFVVGSNTFDINPLPDGTADMSVRLFRSTSTTGTKALALYAGDNTSTIVHQLSVTGVTTFNTQGSAALDFNIRGDTDSNLFYVDASADAVGFGTNTPSYKVDVAGTMRATTSLTTPLLTTATNVDLVINPAGTGAVQFPNDQTLRTSSFDSSFPINGWQINEVAGISGYSALTIGKIQADELAVRVFVADEVRVDRGDEYWTKSYGIVAATFTTPASIGGTVSIAFEDSPALTGAIFTNNDWVLIRKLDIDTGITLSNIWGQVATYVNNSDGTQNWTFTLRSGPTSESVTKGSLAIDFGASGAALIHLSVIDAAGAPYIKMRKWAGANPYTPSNFTTYIQLGELGSTANAYVTPAGYGLYVRSTSDASRFLLADDNGLQIRGASFKMYDGAAQTVDISSTDGSMKLGTDVSSSATTALDFDASTGDLSITGDLYTSDVYLTEASGILINVGDTESAVEKKSITWHADIDSPSATPILGMYGAVLAGGDTYGMITSYSATQFSSLYLKAIGPSATTSQIFMRSRTSSDSIIELTSDEVSMVAALTRTGVLTVSGNLTVSGGNIAVSGTVDGVDIAAFKTAYDSHTHSGYLATTGGTLTGTVITDILRPATNNTKTVGTASYYYSAGYFENLYVNTIVGTPEYSHTHSAGEITSGTLDFARIPTTWNGALTLDADTGLTSNYVRWTTQTSTLKAWDLIGRAHDYATSAQQNDLLLTYTDNTTSYIVWQADSGTRVIDFLNTPTVGGTAVSLSGHTHDDRYFTETESDARFAPLSHNQAYTTITYSGLTSGHFFKATGSTSVGFSALTSGEITAALTYTPVNKAGDTMTGRLTVSSASLISTFSGTAGGAIVQGILDTETSFARAWFGHNAEWDGDLWNIDAIGANDTAGFLVPNGSSSIQLIFHSSTGNTSRTMDHTTFVAGEKFRFTNAGRLGVLNTSPSYEVDVTGSIRASTSVLTPTVTTASGSLSLTSAGGTVAVTGALTASSTLAVTGAITGSSTAAFATSVSAPTVTTASGNLTLTSATSIVAVTGALTGSSTGVFTGTLTAASDTDATNTFGRVRLGYAAATDTASFAHFDQNTSTNFALSQSAAGATVINAISGQTLSLSNAGSATVTVSASGIDLQSGKYVGTANFTSRQTGWRVDDLGSGDFRTLYADEMHVKSFIADLEQALAGGQIISKSVAVLASDFVAPYAGGTQVLTVEDLPSASNMAVFEANDIVALRSFDRSAPGTLTVGYCFGTVTNYADGAGVQTWTFTRSGTTTYNNITQRGTATSNSTSSGTSVTVTKPTGVISGDVMLAVVTHDGSADTITATGWTIIGAYTNGTDINFAMYYKVAGGSEGSNYSFSTVSSHALAASIVAYYNVASPVFDDYSISTNAASTSMTGTTVFGTATANMLVFLGGITNNSASTPPSGMTELVDAGSTGIRVYVAHQTLAASGETGSKVATISASHASIVGMVALRPTYSAMSSSAGQITPGTTIEADGLVLDFGVAGDGYYEVSAIDSTGPYSRVVTYATHPFTDGVVRAQMGNLTGISGATSGEYGLYAGSGTIGTTAQYLRVSTAGVQLNNIPIKLYNAGTQTVNIDSAGTDIWVGPSSSDKRLTWNGTTLSLRDSDVSLYSGGNKAVGINPTYGLDYRIGTNYTDEIPTITWRATAGTGNALARVAAYQTSNDTGMDIRVLPPDTSHKGSLSIVAYNSDVSAASGIAFETPAASGTTSAALTIYGNNITFTSSPLSITFGSKASLSSNGGLSVSPTAGTSAVTVTTPTNQTVAGITVGNANCGSSYGPFISIGYNTNGSTPSAAWLRMYRRDGSSGDLWVDASGNLRIGALSAVTNATDSGGTVVGTQTSSLDTKNLVGEFTDYDDALNAIVAAPIYNFTYKSGAFNGEQFTGIITDYSPAFGMDRDDEHPHGKSLNAVNAHGYTFAAIRALHGQIAELRVQVEALQHAI